MSAEAVLTGDPAASAGAVPDPSHNFMIPDLPVARRPA